MKQLIFLVILTGGAHAFLPVSDTRCNATEIKCTPVLGGSVYIQLMTNASTYDLHCKKVFLNGTTKVFSSGNGKVTIEAAFRERIEFFIDNGTLKITNVENSDSGQYSVEVYDQDGIRRKSINFNLEVREDILQIVVPVCIALGVFLILLLCYYVCRKVIPCGK